MPRVSATIAWNPPATPDMSTTPVSTCTLPSGDIRQAAAAAFVAPGQQPRASPTPSPSTTLDRDCQTGLPAIASSTCPPPVSGHVSPSTIGEPADARLRRRISIGSMPRSTAISSTSVSSAIAVGGALGPRYAPTPNRFVRTP